MNKPRRRGSLGDESLQDQDQGSLNGGELNAAIEFGDEIDEQLLL
jgi:hypothetical protein